MGAGTCTIFSIQRFSTEDGPGIRTTLFFKGCPLKCPWCHNPEGMASQPEIVWQSSLCMGCGDCIPACPNQAIQPVDSRLVINRNRCRRCSTCVNTCPTGALELNGRTCDAPSLLDEVTKDRTFYETSGGGITLSGGEPLLQHRFLSRFLPLCRQQGLHVALDTSGFAPAEWLEPLLEWIDLVLFDLKLIDPDEHLRLTGVPQDTVLSNLDLIVSRGLPVWVRTPVIPGFTDNPSNLRGLAACARQRVHTLRRYDLLAFSNLCGAKYEMLNRPFPLAGRPLLTRRAMQQLSDVVREAGIEPVHWSGATQGDS